MSYTKHYSVLKKECINFLSENANFSNKTIFGDLTFGGGGHTAALAELNENSFVYSTDQDPDALKNGKELIDKIDCGKRINLISTNFENFPEIIKKDHPEAYKTGFQGIMIDLGVSSHHFDEGDRGFSFRFDAKLDMRMNHFDDRVKTAADVVNELSVEELTTIFSEYGEERFSERIAERICDQRSEKRIETTKDLEDIIFHCYPKKMRFGKLNPSTRCFQALRIFVNRELEVLESVIPNLVPLLRPGGRLAIISFHSLEDRIVKNVFKALKKSDDSVSILTKRPLVPTEEEILENSRSRSAKLRVLEKL